MSPLIVARGLGKRYGTRTALHEVSFEVLPGQVLGLLGPNGSGKSTVLRILTGYLCPSVGTAEVAGFDVRTHSLEVRRRIGYVPEDVPLYPNMIVEEFLRFMGTLRGIARAALGRAVADAGERLSLGAVWTLPIAKLSRGYRQRVAIAQALLGGPELLVLDEPTNGLDPRQIMEMRGLIRELARSHTLLVTSHILSEIEQVASHAAILLDGRLLTVEAIADPSRERGVRATVADGEPRALAIWAETLPEVRAATAATCAGGGVELRATLHTAGDEAALAAALVGRGYRLTGLALEGGRLEARFLELTAAHAAAPRRAA